MQPFKKLLSWLSGIAMVGGSLIEVLQKSGIIFAPDTIYGKAIFTAGLVVLFLRNLTADNDGDGTPDILQRGTTQSKKGAASIAVLLALASVGLIALMACTPAFAKVSPGVSLEVAADSILVTYGCDGDAPNVACLATIADSATGAVLVSNARLTFGQLATLPPRFCTSSGRVAFIGTFVGVTATGKQGPPVTVTGGGTCDLAGGAVRPTLNVQIRPGGL